MKMNYIYTSISLLCLLSVFSFSGCELDDRMDDLTGGYEGILIDKLTGDTVSTEYYGAKIKLLDMAYGEVAQPLVYNILPSGEYKNTKVYPSKYKIWAEGPFYQQDTIFGDIKQMKNMNLTVTPNISLTIEKIELKFGIAAEVTYAYEVYNPYATSSDIGIVYGTDRYPGFRTAMNETESAKTYKRITTGLTAKTGTFTETIYLEPHTVYYLRALGKTNNSGDYWNYSKQHVISASDVDISGIPLAMKQGVTSATSAVLQWTFPESIVDKIKVSYTDKDGTTVTDLFAPGKSSYIANLPYNSTTAVSVELLTKTGESSGVKTIQIVTNALSDYYVKATQLGRPENVPLFNDRAFKMSLSKSYAEIKGPSVDPGWVTSPFRVEFIDWWNSWADPTNMPKNQDIENYTAFTLYGETKSLLDLLPFTNLETLTIRRGEDLFDTGLAIDPQVDLTVLKKLKKLSTVEIGPGVPLTESDFNDAGLAHLTIIKH
ncbi:hypothetical protein G5B30_14735 [Sphingobacterium sp. SGG-5]|nr:hypothetical protein [Sphingobacterium sp. SGG-5]